MEVLSAGEAPTLTTGSASGSASSFLAEQAEKRRSTDRRIKRCRKSPPRLGGVAEGRGGRLTSIKSICLELANQPVRFADTPPNLGGDFRDTIIKTLLSPTATP